MLCVLLPAIGYGGQLVCFFFFFELADSIGEFQSCTDVIGTLFPHYSDFLTVHFFHIVFVHLIFYLLIFLFFIFWSLAIFLVCEMVCTFAQ